MNAAEHRLRTSIAEELGKEPLLYYQERKLLKEDRLEEFIELVLRRKRLRYRLIGMLAVGFVFLVLLTSIIQGGAADPDNSAAMANWLVAAFVVGLGTLPDLRSVHRLELLQSLLTKLEAESSPAGQAA
ncbi:hypothetical protein Mal4_19960 [Maioricimonas rarisocia]|uniref:Uncharacterized protein n=1 Tax=Maioricimonas rarisocia TaxID=2528026 RepID=A0A517Z5A8_9PLAN|nr:hypothetical protein [Maioricimonas rarisocia]QDU37680.1 hypothetical protein Mal4_19960 [Maioricimonas rarisocia]